MFVRCNTLAMEFQVAGAIVTYELVLIQFNENLLKEVSEDNSTCSSTALGSL